MNYIGIIPARYASTRFPGKPLAMLGGKPVIQRVYEQVSGVMDDVLVATDDERILKTVEGFGGKAVMTRADHKSGTDRCYEAYVLQGKPYDVVVNIQGDEPFIQPQQLEAVKACFEDPQTEIATLVKPFTPADGWPALENVNSPKVVVNQPDAGSLFQPFHHSLPTQQGQSGVVEGACVLQAYRLVCLQGRRVERDSPPCRNRRWNWPNRWNNYGGWKTAIPSRWASAKLKPSASTHRPTSKRPKLS